MVQTISQRAATSARKDPDEVDGVPTKTPPAESDPSSPASPPPDGDGADRDPPPRKAPPNGGGDVAAAGDAAASGDDGGAGGESIVPESKSSEMRSYAAMALLAAITYAAYPGPSWGGSASREPTVHTVFYYGWISAISTGFGVLPLCFVSEMDGYWVGVSNAVAAGMMCAASYSLFYEGCTFSDDHDSSHLPASARTGIGCILGLLFILGTKSFLDRNEDVKLGSLNGADTRKILLIIFVMTLHSFSEGVGIGVSFGGEHGGDLGVFISASLAVHNVPEGLAVAIVLLPRKVSKATAAVWCVVTSLPQPLMAVPAFMFVHSFLPLLPVGLGFAGGAMMWVAFMELLLEAYEDTDATTTGVVSAASLAVMISIQRKIEDHA